MRSSMKRDRLSIGIGPVLLTMIAKVAGIATLLVTGTRPPSRVVIARLKDCSLIMVRRAYCESANPSYSSQITSLWQSDPSGMK